MQTKRNREFRLKTKKSPDLSPTDASSWFFWIIFFVMTAANFLIAYSGFSIGLKLWVFSLGVLLPLLGWLQRETVRKTPPLSLVQMEIFAPQAVAMGWVLILGFTFFSRFWKIDSLFAWPLGDEGLNGVAAVELSRHWSWKFFYTSGQAPPLPVWTTACLLKMGFSPLMSLWFPSAAASFLTVAAGYFAARQFFSRSFALVVAGLFAFSFWPLWMGRFCHQGVWVPLWTCGCLYILGRFLKEKPGSGRIREAFFLGLVTGLGSFTFTPWPSVALVTGMIVLFSVFQAKKKDWKTLGNFAAGTFISLIPFMWAVFHEGYGGHLRETSAWGQVHGAFPFEVPLGYLSVLGWGTFQHSGFYIPDTGGFLNPILTSLFCLGLIRVVRAKPRSFSFWLIPASVILFLPGFLSLNVEGFRVAQVLPWLILITAFGFQPLLEAVPSHRRLLAASIVLFLSFFFDWGRLTLPYMNISGNPKIFSETGRPLARYRAYLALKTIASEKGPGLILSEWDIPADRTLDFASFPFNAASNPSLPPSEASWLAIVTDAHYRPFLAKRFPQSQWSSLDSDFSKDGNRDLMVIDATDETRSLLLKWAAADKAFREINEGIDHIHDRDCQEKMDRIIREDYPLVQGDPYLESCFWEKASQFYYYSQGHFSEHLRALQLAIQRGYPSSHLYRQWAELLWLSGNRKGSEQAGIKAKESEALYPWRSK